MVFFVVCLFCFKCKQLLPSKSHDYFHENPLNRLDKRKILILTNCNLSSETNAQHVVNDVNVFSKDHLGLKIMRQMLQKWPTYLK